MLGQLIRIHICVFFCWFIVSASTPVYSQTKDIPTLKNQGAQISFMDTLWDFGTITQGKKTEHSFVFKNIGSELLVIKNVRSTCGCTAVVPSKNSLESGETATLKVTFDSEGREGLQSKTIYVTTNDNSTPITALTIKGTIEIPPGPRIAYEPKSWDFGLQQIGATPQTKITIKNTGIDNLTVHTIQAPDNISVSIDPKDSISVDDASVMTIFMEPLDKAGVVEQYVHFQTNDSTQSRVTIRITGYVEGTLPPNLLVIPASWDFGVIDSLNDKTVKTTLTLFNSGGSPVTVDSLNVPYGFEALASTPLTIDAGKEMKIPLKLTQLSQKGTVKQYMFIHSNDPEQSTHRINIYGYIKEAE